MTAKDFILLLEQKSAEFRAIVRCRKAEVGNESNYQLHKWLLSCDETVGNSRGVPYKVSWLYAEMIRRFNESQKG